MKRTLTFIRLIAIVFALLFITSCNTNANPAGTVDSTTSASIVEESSTTTETSITSETTADPNSIFEIEEPGKKVLKFDNLLYEDFGLGKESQQIVTFLSFLQYYDIAEKTPEEVWQHVNSIPFNGSILRNDSTDYIYFGNYKSQNIGFWDPTAVEVFLNTTLTANKTGLSVETVKFPKYISTVTKYINEGKPVIYFLDKNLGTSKEGSYDFTYTFETTSYQHSYDKTFVVIVGYDYDCLYYYDSGSPELKEYKWVSGSDTKSWFHAIVPSTK